jgi:XRE family transcriptional regulator, regulator of sulfur utilization
MLETVTPQLGPVIQQRRKALGQSLAQLAALSGVSKSMLSQIERGTVNPTFAVLWALTRAMHIEFADLVGSSSSTGTSTEVAHDSIEVVCPEHTPEIRSADGLCRLRILSPPHLAGSIEWYELEFQPAGELNSAGHSAGTSEHFTAETEGFEITSDGATRVVDAGATARYQADVPHAIVNRSKTIGRGYLVVLYNKPRVQRGLDRYPV